MIESLKITNFQRHLKSYLKFSTGVNTIVGETDSGKSAIIRALLWFIRSTSQDYRTHGEKEVKAELIVDGKKITRIKNNSGQILKLDDLEFKAFGKTFPEEIEDLINMTEVNYQLQKDMFYLLNNTSGQVAQHFNKIANLELIDKSVSNIQKQITSITKEINFDKKEIEEKKESLHQFNKLKSWDKKLKSIESLESSLKDLQINKETLENLISKFLEIQEKIKKLEKITELENKVNSILTNIQNKSYLINQFRTLKNFSLEIYYAKKDQEKHSLLQTTEPKVNKILNLIENKQKQQAYSLKLKNLTDNIKNYKETLKNKQNVLNNLEIEFKENFPKTCPLCGNNVKV